jgi:hypothetical protein
MLLCAVVVLSCCTVVLIVRCVGLASNRGLLIAELVLM